MALDNSGSPQPTTRPARTTTILETTIAVIIGVVVLGALLGAIWLPGVGFVALAALVGLFFILWQGAAAMNEPGNFGQGLTAVIAAVFVLPAAIGASLFIGATVGVSDEMSYDECMADPGTTVSECLELP